jgi:hypothetical protein
MSDFSSLFTVLFLNTPLIFFDGNPVTFDNVEKVVHYLDQEEIDGFDDYYALQEH